MKTGTDLTKNACEVAQRAIDAATKLSESGDFSPEAVKIYEAASSLLLARKAYADAIVRLDALLSAKGI